MPTIPLYTKPSHPDAWHQVRAPGGYEWWYFDGEDATSDMQFVAILFEGFVFHPQYLRRYARFQRSPTRVVPPVAGDYPCLYFALYRAGRLESQFMMQYPSETFEALPERPAVRLGLSGFFRDRDGRLQVELRGHPWILTWKGPQLQEQVMMHVQLTLRPRFDHPPIERVFLSQAMSGAEHHWVLANPMCDVEATIKQIHKKVPQLARATFIQGRAYHDHNYGTGPIGRGIARWMWGRVLLDDVAITFHYAQSRDRSLGDEVHLVEAGPDGVRDVAVSEIRADWSGRTRVRLAYPRSIAFDDALRLSNPRTIDVSPFYMRLNYDAEIHGCRHGRALCEIAYPHRLRWPILGRMIEMSIDRRRITSRPGV